MTEYMTETLMCCDGACGRDYDRSSDKGYDIELGRDWLCNGL